MSKQFRWYFRAILFGVLSASAAFAQQRKNSPNIIFIMTDQFRAQATGYSGDKNAITPTLDKLASVSVNVKNAVSGMPVCTPYRAALLTGQYPLTSGVFMNDVMLDTNARSIAKVYKEHGYNTGFIGKWHLDGHGRSSYIPEGRRQGFDYWKALECSHDYNNSIYYAGNSAKKMVWEGFDALAQSRDACQYIREQSAASRPFMLFISLAPPHNPYHAAPAEYKKLYEPREIRVNENVPERLRDSVKKELKGYYSNISVIDDCVEMIWSTLKKANLEENTILVFTSDHGDLLGAHGKWNKQQPYEESIRVPFLIHFPSEFGNKGRSSPILLNTPDIMPTLLGLSGLPIPKTAEGVDFSSVLKGAQKNHVKGTLISCVQPFGEWNRKRGGKEFRGVITEKYTYVRDLKGPWLLFNNIKDPFQLNNLCGIDKYKNTERRLAQQLDALLIKRKDEFKPGMVYVRSWNYFVDESETVPYKKFSYEGKPLAN